MSCEPDMIVIMSKQFIEQLIGKAQKHRVLEKGAFLFHEGDPVRSVFVIDEGLIELQRPQRDGASITLQRAAKCTVLAEASAYSSAYHCDALVMVRSTVFQLSRAAFLTYLTEDPSFSQQWANHLAQEVQSARYRSEILSRKTVAERLDGWMVWRDCGLPAKGQWKSIAEQIGVSPEALYRELARRKNSERTNAR